MWLDPMFRLLNGKSSSFLYGQQLSVSIYILISKPEARVTVPKKVAGFRLQDAGQKCLAGCLPFPASSGALRGA
jgi:hypothetical protein